MGLALWFNAKESACQADVGSIPGLGRFPEEGNDNSLQYPCLGNPVDRKPGKLQSIGSQKLDILSD